MIQRHESSSSSPAPSTTRGNGCTSSFGSPWACFFSDDVVFFDFADSYLIDGALPGQEEMNELSEIRSMETLTDTECAQHEDPNREE
jgi:hypothetical protein